MEAVRLYLGFHSTKYFICPMSVVFLQQYMYNLYFYSVVKYD